MQDRFKDTYKFFIQVEPKYRLCNTYKNLLL